MRKIVRMALPAILVLVIIWSALGVWDNLNRNTGTVSFEWVNGEYEISYDPDGAEPRPLLATMDFLVSIGNSAKSLVLETAVACQRLANNINPDIIGQAPADDLAWYEAFLVWLEYIVDILIALVQIILELCLFVVKLALWVVSVVPNILGFLLTGSPLYDMDAVVELLNNPV